ncbi:alpha/beta fold hydrolase [Kribbella sp. NPDC058245]|uniref:alpha/beta fold hydrolase n=1 Tax=Kribbella sp. NPDC058245 TaxID=3346399 RepID=UPI0036EC93F5
MIAARRDGGEGKSSNRPGRQVVDAARWTERIADELGLGELALLGTSGGGPHAAAAAAGLGDRVRRLCLVAGLGPDEMPGFDPAAGMVAETRQEIACARAGETPLRVFIDELMKRPDPLDDWLSQLPPSDVEILGRGEVRLEDQAIQSEAMRQGPEGWIEDDLALFHRPWGFQLSDVTAETLLLYGFEDVLVPANHGDAYVMELGHGQLVKIPDAGHWMRDYESDVLNWLVSPAQGPARIIG